MELYNSLGAVTPAPAARHAHNPTLQPRSPTITEDAENMQIQPVQQLQTPTTAEEVEFMQTQPDLFNFQECMENITNTLELG